MRETAKSTVPALLRALRDEDGEVREEAEEALERIVRVLTDEDAELRGRIAAALTAATGSPEGRGRR